MKTECPLCHALWHLLEKIQTYFFLQIQRDRPKSLKCERKTRNRSKTQHALKCFVFARKARNFRKSSFVKGQRNTRRLYFCILWFRNFSVKFYLYNTVQYKGLKVRAEKISFFSRLSKINAVSETIIKNITQQIK